ncbi:hypothetical protein [Flavobacterium anhuiense]|uniref:hypothetical protein n=1 Tax=Flavobacterium anhuiense TaxID=459526 RepID=UPI003D9938AC
MNLDIYSQYNSAEKIINVKIQNAINANFIHHFVNDFKLLLLEKEKIGNGYIEEIRFLKLSIERIDYQIDEDFDLLFISYLTLLKLDFPNVEIEFHFNNFLDSVNANSYLFKIAHHRTHLYINSKKIFFRIFKDNMEFMFSKVSQSVSYMPPLIINRETLSKLFLRKTNSNNYKSNLIYEIRQLKNDNIILSQQKEPVLNRIQELFVEDKGKLENWQHNDLSTLYLLKALSELYILRYFINNTNGVKSTYQIGLSIIESKDDRQNEKKFRERVMEVLESNDVFLFSDVEVYIFSLIIQNSDLFKIPTSLRKMYNKIEFLVDEIDKKKLQNYETSKNSERFLKSKFIDIYVINLQRIIDYTKDVSYGLQELAKNTVEHTKEKQNEGYGIISARIYALNKLKELKNISSEWLKDYNNSHKFMDINVIDSGSNSVIKNYIQTLENELPLIDELKDLTLKLELKDEYEKDIKQLRNYLLNNLFNFDSLQLMHQINRTKSRLGLLIFSQTILYDKKAFVSLASNNIDEFDNIGYFLYNRNNTLINESNPDYLSVGTNYNFTIPVSENFEYSIKKINYEGNQSSSASSVFQELHSYGLSDNHSSITINDFKAVRNYNQFNKYTKLDSLRSEIGTADNSKILLLDAANLSKILENSSDWVRFLAGLQFTESHFRDIIIINFDLELYQEFINVLKIFNNLDTNSQGFWKKDRYVLFFLPVKNDNENVFWFNSLLCSNDYEKFLKINEDINLYHQNLSSLLDKSTDSSNSLYFNYSDIDSLLFSSTKRLLNFELLIKNENGLTLFEETLKSLTNIEIDNTVNEN